MSKFHAISWLLFAATAFISALLMPAIIFYYEFGSYFGLKISYGGILFKILIFIALASTIYHGLYRIKPTLQERIRKAEGLIEAIIFTIAAILLIFSLVVIAFY